MSQILPESAKKRVGDIMTTHVITVAPNTPVSQIARLMSDHDIGGVPVMADNGEIVGVVTELDLIVRNTRFKMPAFFTILDMAFYLETPGHYQERLKHILGTHAEEIMGKPAKTISPRATIEELAELMVERRMNPIPVVDDGKLVGIVSRSDIVRMMAREFEDGEPES
ncbi:MAG: CBS domain-containing protein [Chloroflexi bacterium]|nr:MAG: CBS domain-containing protein [Chloroflexota bacterium]